jgi:fucose permease
MPALDRPKVSASTLTFAAYASFLPIGIANVLLGPLLPTLSARWSLNYAQAGALFPAQYLAATCAVALSGILVAKWGFRFAMKTGLSLMALGLALLLMGPKLLGIFCLIMFGAGIGIAVPAANLLVAEVNPEHRSASLNSLNFCWSMGAVACPFLVALAARSQNIPVLLACVALVSLIVVFGIAWLPAGEPPTAFPLQPKISFRIRSREAPFLVLAALFFVYVGTETSFGQWIASYAKGLRSLTPAMSLITTSFFYGALTFGRWLAPFLLRSFAELKLVKSGLLLACAGTAGLVLSRGLSGVLASACAAGLGLSCVYPITIALLSSEFGPASSAIGSLMFVLANIGGAVLPWIVGVSSSRLGSLKAGLLIPLIGCVAMLILYQRDWSAPARAN